MRFSVQIPVGDYKTKKGVRLEANGVKPDLEVPLDASQPAAYGVADQGIVTAAKAVKGEVKPAASKKAP